MIWATLMLLLICSGMVSGSETALFGVSQRTLHEFGQSRSPLRRRVAGLMQRPRRVLMTVLITNTAVNVAIFAVSVVALREFRGTRPAVAAAGGVVVLLAVIIFGEMLPKAVALSHTRRFAPGAGALLAVLQVVLAPLRWVLGTLLVDPIIRLVAPSTRQEPLGTDELRLLVEHSARDGAIDSQENELLQAAVALGDVRVHEVLTPRVDIQSIGLGQDRDTVRQKLREARRRKLPVFDRDLDDIQGLIYARDVYLHSDTPIESLLRPVHFVPEQISLLQLIRHFRVKKTQFAIVVDEYGGTAGLISVEDVVERIVGELPDPDSARPAPTTERLDENTYRLSGDLSVRRWAERFAVGEIDRDTDTVGGLVLARLGRLPRVGDMVRIHNLTLTVERMHKRRIEHVILHRGEMDPPTEGNPR